MQNGHHKDEELYSKLTSQYSEACQAFVLRDFDTTASIVTSLLEQIEQDSPGLGNDASSPSDLDELVRRVWILQVTLLASADDELARNAKQAERELAGLHSRIERFYARRPAATAATSTSSSPPSPSETLIHPSLLVAISLAGLKLDIPSFVRRTLQDYFQLLIAHAASSEAALSASQGDISTLDVSHADLSLSGIAVNGHVSQVDGTNGHLTNGMHASNEVSTSSAASRMKSLQRLSRIYSIHLLGKALDDWSGAKAWIREQADDDSAVAAGITSHSYAQVRLNF